MHALPRDWRSGMFFLSSVLVHVLFDSVHSGCDNTSMWNEHTPRGRGRLVTASHIRDEPLGRCTETNIPESQHARLIGTRPVLVLLLITMTLGRVVVEDRPEADRSRRPRLN